MIKCGMLHPGNSQIVKNTFWLFSGNVSIALITFISSIIVARFLGPDSFGQLQLATAYFTVLFNLENFINPNVFKKALLQNLSRQDQLISCLGTAISIVGLFLTICCLIFYLAFGMKEAFLLVFLMTSSMLFRFSNGISFFYDSNLQSKKTLLAQVVSISVASFLKCVAVVAQPLIFLQALMVPVQHLLSLIIHLFIYLRGGTRKLGLNLNFGLIRPLVLISLPLLLSSFVDLISNRMGLFVVGSRLGNYSVGILSAATKLSEPWLFAGAALCSSYWPKLVQLKEANSKTYDTHVSFVFGILFYTSIVISLTVLFSADFFVVGFLGARYGEALPVLKVHIFTLVFLSLGALTSLWEINEGLTRLTLIKNIMALGLNFLLNHWLISQLGIVGASYSAVITYAFSSTFGCLLFKQTRRLVLLQLAAPYTAVRVVIEKLRLDF